MNIKADFYPEETTWQILDLNNELIASGGPYGEDFEDQLISTPVCLERNSCYVFQIFDAAGDGICCDFGEGNYYILSPEGDTLLSENGVFESENSHTFCHEMSMCDLTASTTIVYNSEEEKSEVSIQASGGEAPYSYSLDGGLSFQTDSLFADVPGGEYQLRVKDATDSCQFSDVLNLSGVTPIDDLGVSGYEFTNIPNPNDGYFKIEFSLEGLQEPSLDFEIIDIRGKIIQSRRMSSYNGVYSAPVSLLSYPAGMYFVRVLGDAFQVTKKVLKQ